MIISIAVNGGFAALFKIAEYIVEYSKQITSKSLDYSMLCSCETYWKSNSLNNRIKAILYYLGDICITANRATDFRDILIASHAYPEIQCHITSSCVRDFNVFLHRVANDSEGVYVWKQFFAQNPYSATFLDSVSKLHDSQNEDEVIHILSFLKSSLAVNLKENELRLLKEAELTQNQVSMKEKESSQGTIECHATYTAIDGISTRIENLLNESNNQSDHFPLITEKRLISDWKALKSNKSNGYNLMERTANAFLSKNKCPLKHSEFVENTTLLFQFSPALLSHPLIFKSIFLKVSHVNLFVMPK